MKKIMSIIALLLLLVPDAYGKSLSTNSESTESVIELGVEMIQRICPTVIWDHWRFCNVEYDHNTKAVVVVVQLNNWDDNMDYGEFTDETVLKEAEWIITNIKEAYDALITEPSISCDGDFMLYLSLGTLLKQMEKDNVNLRIILLKPDFTNQVFGDHPLILDSERINSLKVK